MDSGAVVSGAVLSGAVASGPVASGPVDPLEIESVPVLLRPVVESRPPAHRFGDAGPIEIDDVSGEQPSLLDVAPEPPAPTAGPPRPRGARIHIDTGPGAVSPADGLPDPAGSAALLGFGIAQALIGTRPISQLDTWLDPVVLADLRYAIRGRLRGRRSAAEVESVRVQSVRVQCPTPTSVEATVHLRVGTGSMVLGARLEADGQRWVCTALARPTGPPRSTTGPPRARGIA